MKDTWYRKFNLEYNLDELLVWARKTMLSQSSSRVGERVSNTQIFWPGSIPEGFWNRCNKIAPLRNFYNDWGPRYGSVWEYPDYDILRTHIDDPGKGVTSLIVPLIGRFKTDRYKRIDELSVDVTAEELNRYEASQEVVDIVSKEVDHEPYESIEYGPGSIFLLNNSKYFHGGEPIDGYRLCLQLYVCPDYELDKLFKI